MLERLNENELRAYPLAEDTLRQSDGVTLPDDLVVDLRIMTDRSHGRLYLSQVRVTPSLVSLAICSEAGVGVACAMLARPAAYGTAVPLTPLVPLTSGYAVFGRALDSLDSLVFTSNSVAVSGLDPAVVLPVDGSVVSSVSKYGVTYAGYQAKGLVSLVVTSPVTVRYESGRIIFGLEADQAAQFLGPCDRRDSAGMCGRTAIRSINGVCPDANGTITIRVTEVCHV